MISDLHSSNLNISMSPGFKSSKHSSPYQSQEMQAGSSVEKETLSIQTHNPYQEYKHVFPGSELAD